jgi:hypothetical protein
MTKAHSMTPPAIREKSQFRAQNDSPSSSPAHDGTSLYLHFRALGRPFHWAAYFSPSVHEGANTLPRQARRDAFGCGRATKATIDVGSSIDGIGQNLVDGGKTRTEITRLRRSAEADQTSAARSLAGADQRASRWIHRLADLCSAAANVALILTGSSVTPFPLPRHRRASPTLYRRPCSLLSLHLRPPLIGRGHCPTAGRGQG